MKKNMVLLLILMMTCSMTSSWTRATIIESNIPDLGQRSHLALTIETEEILGQGAMQQLRASDQLVQDTVVDEYLNNLSQKLTKALNSLDYRLDYKLKIFGFESDVLNAFAFLGGHVAVHTGLILALENEAELAAVLSHETAHIAQRHLARIFTNNKKLTTLTYAELLAAILIGALGSPEAGSHLAKAVMGGHLQQLINYTRDHEQEADRIGIQILAKAGFDPKAFPEVFRILSLKTRYNEKPPEYLLTHPVHESRIADCTNRLKHLAYEPKPSDNLFFQLVRARIEAENAETPKQRLKRIGDKMARNQYPDRTIADYTYALALVKNKQFAQAAPILFQLEQQFPEVWIFSLSRAELELEANNFENAVSLLQPLFEKHRHLHPVVLKYTEALLATHQAELAEQILNQHRKAYPNDTQVLQRLAKTYSQLKKPILLHQTQGNWHSLRGEFVEALHQFDIALEYTEPGSKINKQVLAEKNKIIALRDLQKKTKI